MSFSLMPMEVSGVDFPFEIKTKGSRALQLAEKNKEELEGLLSVTIKRFTEDS